MSVFDFFVSMPMFWVVCLIAAGALIFVAVYYVRSLLGSSSRDPTLLTRFSCNSFDYHSSISLFLLLMSCVVLDFCRFFVVHFFFFFFFFTPKKLVSLTDLESDYQNPIDMCRNCNQV
jgi:hypothetical protein